MSVTVNVDDLALELLRAERERTSVRPLTERFPDLTIDQAYRVQLAGVQARLNEGRRVIGKKIGLTSKAMQELLGVSEPDYGHLFDHMIVPNGQPISTDRLLKPRCEGEIAFLLARDLEGPGVTIATVLASTEAVMPALEIVDSRIRDWDIKIQDTIADNASSGMVVLGGRPTSVRDLDLSLIGMVLKKDGEIVDTGAGAAALGHPASAVAWLANKLSEFEVTLKAGEVVLSGSLATAPWAVAGDHFRADFDRLGHVAVRFT